MTSESRACIEHLHDDCLGWARDPSLECECGCHHEADQIGAD